MMQGISFLLLMGLSASSLACHQSMPAKSSDGTGNNSRKANVSYTVVAKNIESLPRCDHGTQGMKVYLKSDDEFLKCESFSWRSSQPGDMKGRFADREPVRYYEWTDEKLRLRWAAPHRDEIDLALVRPEVCAKGFRLPTEGELKASAGNGLFDGVKAHGGVGFDRAWTHDKSAFAGLAKGEFETFSGRQVKNLKAGVYCVGPA